ncbi:MAG: hypothetical protein II939_04195 [Bacteroidales bacterium]|nr:hypothetical protein [Bacteroidales bacterium]
MKKILYILFLFALLSSCSSGDNNKNTTSSIYDNGIPTITPGGQITVDTLVSFLRHFGKLNVCERTLRGDIIINDTLKIKKLLGKSYPRFLDKYTNRILKVPYDVNVKIGFDINEIASSIKVDGENCFIASKPTPKIDITGIDVRFDQEYREIGITRWDIDNMEFSSNWQSANVNERIQKIILNDRRDEFIDAVLTEAVTTILNGVRNRYQNINFRFDSSDPTPIFNEIPNPVIE